MSLGKVYIVGAGPGDPELITLKGKRAIEAADIIFYDRLINKQLLSYAKPDAELIYCGKRPNHHAIKQEVLNRLLVHHAQTGKMVTRLKGGDPFVYGRGGEEAEYLSMNGIPFEIIPGITAGIAAPAYAGIPITHRQHSRSFAVVSGHDLSWTDVKWESLVKGVDTLIIYMGMNHLTKICEELIRHGKDMSTPVALIQWGTTSQQAVLNGTLANIAKLAHIHDYSNPVIIVVGEVVRLKEKLSWFCLPLETIHHLGSVSSSWKII